MGGVNERRIGGATPEDVEREIADALQQTNGGRGLIVAPGCTVPTETPPANLDAFKQAVERAPASAG
jgi:uroporphyrinogen decarboxylase